LSSNPIAELAGVGAPVVMCLNRVGINTVADLLKANPDEVAYLLDSYDEAERVLRAARKHAADAAEASEPAAEHDDDEADAPAVIHSYADETSDELPALREHPAMETDALTGLGAALSLVASQIGETGPGLGLCERLGAVALVLEHGGSASEAIAAVLHDAVLSPGWTMSAADARARFGDQVGDLVAECARIQGVPLSPIGRPQALYVEMVSRITPSARRVCAAQALASVRLARSLWVREGHAVWGRFHGGREFCLWYYRALAGALASAESTPLTRELIVGVERLAQAGGESLSIAA
jgi:predicted flap endonuclease-1-like 5' DNA nuclease